MSKDDGSSLPDRTSPPWWASWRFAVGLVIALTIAKLAYNTWLSPWDLVGDEAYYWQQARHLGWCYNEKGPLLPWMIAASCRLFGDVEWAVRLPAVLAWGASAWGVGRLGIAASHGDQRVGALATILFLLIPAFQANALICTQDAPMILLWIAMTAVGMGTVRRWRTGAKTWVWWLSLYALLGAGMLLKQSVLTFLPGMAIYWWLNRKSLPLKASVIWQQIAGVAVLAAMCTPIVWWNAKHGWPTLEHTLGHLGAGGDQAGRVNKGNPLTWEGGLLGGLLGFFGPMLPVMAWGTFRTWRDTASPARVDYRWIACSGWFSTVFYAALALTKPAVATWPIPNMAPLVVLAAAVFAPVLFDSVPGHHLRRLWRGALAYGLIGAALMAYPTPVLRIPALARAAGKKMFGTFGHARDEGERLAAVMTSAPPGSTGTPLLLAPNYGLACLSSFYIPGHPPVATRDMRLTNRPSTLGQWPDTDIDDPSHRGVTLVLMQDHRNDPDWSRVLRASAIVSSPDPDFLFATNFQGFREPAGAPSLAARGPR